VHARKRGVECFEKREKDVKRGKNKEKSMCMEKKERKIEKKREKIYMKGRRRIKRDKRSGH
jgi:hypothetical protein